MNKKLNKQTKGRGVFAFKWGKPVRSPSYGITELTKARDAYFNGRMTVGEYLEITVFKPARESETYRLAEKIEKAIHGK